MAFVVLTTTMSFTVHMHYCGEKLVAYSLTSHAQSCGMQTKTDSKSCDTQITQKSCCSDKTLTAKGTDDLKPVFHTLDLDQQLVIATFFYSYAALFAPETGENASFLAYSPPPLIRDVQTLDQVFLI